MPKARNLEFDHLMGAAEAAFEPTILLRRIFTTIKQKTYFKKNGVLVQKLFKNER